MAKVVLAMGTPHAPFLNQREGSVEEGWTRSSKRETSPDLRGGGMLMNLDIPKLIEERKGWIEKELSPEVWQRKADVCQDALNTLSKVLADTAPDVVVMIGDDTHEIFEPDEHIPAVDVFAGDSLPWVPWPGRVREPEPARALPGNPALGEHLTRNFTDEGYDVSLTRHVQEGRSVGHAFDFVYSRIMNEKVPEHLPIWLNTYYSPNIPSLSRCYAMGKALRHGIESWDSDARVAIIGTGGLSHMLIDEELDREVLALLQEKDEGHLPQIKDGEERCVYGTSEIRNWLFAAGAMHDSPAQMNLVAYEPCYRSAAGTGVGCGFAYWK